MDEKDDTTPFPREPWQRLLEDASDGPPETTDARIRAAARRDLAPRGRRWWLPASLAASFVLAVFVVQSQFGTLRVPVARESDHGAGGAIEARIIDREQAKEARPAGASPSAPGKRQAESRDEAEADAYGYLESELAADSAGAGPKVGGPERELKEAMELPQESAASGEARVVLDLPASPPAAAEEKDEDLGNVVVTGSRRRVEEITVTGSQASQPGDPANPVRHDLDQAAAVRENTRDLVRLHREVARAGQGRGSGPPARAAREGTSGLARALPQGQTRALTAARRPHSASRRLRPTWSSLRCAAPSFGYAGPMRSSVSTRTRATAARM